jgi:signal transduction histidine kinase
VTRLRDFAQRHALDALIVVGALEAAREAYAAPVGDLWFAVPAVALLVLLLLARHRWPFGAPASIWVLAAAISFADGRLIMEVAAATVAGLAAAFLLGHVPNARQARLGLAVVVGGATTVAYNDPFHVTGDLLVTPILFLIAWTGGYALRERSAQVVAAEERALHAEREREAAARVAVAEERARIARELHDIVAHAVSVMVLQVGAVRRKLPESQDADALKDVERTGRTALAEMRRLLGAMRRDDEDAELAPQPGLDELDPLLQAFRRAGLPVQLAVEGDAYPLPRALDLSAYRIIQEGLTNALKHAQASRAEVLVRYGAGELRIEVRDDGDGAAESDGQGHGLVGVRERVKIYGGEMSAGAVNGGGFALTTRLPLEGAR